MKFIVFILLFVLNIKNLASADGPTGNQSVSNAEGAEDYGFPSTPVEVAQKEKDQKVLVQIKILLLSNCSDKKIQLEKISCEEMDQLSIDGQLAMAELVVSEIPSTARHLFWRVGCNRQAVVNQVMRAASGVLKLGNWECAAPLYKWVLTQSDITFQALCDVGRIVKNYAPEMTTIACCQAALWLPLKSKTAIITYLVKNKYQALIPSAEEQMPAEVKMQDLTMIADGLRTIDEKLRIEILRLFPK